MNALSTFLNNIKTRRIANRYVKENTHVESFKDTKHGRRVYDTFTAHSHGTEDGCLVFVGIGVSYETQQLQIVEGLQSPDGQMAIYIDDKEFFQGTRLGYGDPDVRKIAVELLRRNTVSLGHYATAPAKFL